MEPELKLSLAEWIVLCLICEHPVHGFALAACLEPDGDLGRVWHVHKGEVYRAMTRLERSGLIRVAGKEPSVHGSVRSRMQATPAGRRAAKSWLLKPVAHPRDVRSELLVKLALLARARRDPLDLLRKQHAQLVPIASPLTDQVRTAVAVDEIVAMWRHETIVSTLRFLELTLAAAHTGHQEALQAGAAKSC